MKKTVTELFEKYLECSDLTDSSVDIKRRVFKYYLCLFSEVDIGFISYCHAEDFRNYLAKGRSKQSANIYLQNFKPFFSWLAKRRFIPADPFAEVSLFRIGTEITEVYTEDEIRRMLLVADTRWRTIILLALSSMRRAEILNLTVRDIDFDGSLIYIREKRDSETTWAWTIKNHNAAIVPMAAAVEPLLTELMSSLGSQPYVILPQRSYHRLIDRKQAGTLNFRLRNCPWGNFTRDYYSVLSRASVERKKFHSLRATFATRMDGEDFSLREIQKLMRHSCPQTTARYIRHDQHELIAKSGAVLDKYYETQLPSLVR